MSYKNTIKKFGAIAAVAIMSTFTQAYAATLIDFTSDNSSPVWYGNSLGCGGGCTLGYQFNVSSALTIDGLGVYDADSNGLNNSHDVGIWNSGGGLLASVTVGPGSSNAIASASGTGDFVYGDIGSLLLSAGDYIVGALFSNGDTDAVVFDAGGIFSNDARASYTRLAFVNNAAITLPNQFSTSSDRYFGAGMRISAVPVPAALPLFGTGLAVLGFMGWRRKRRAA
ncbi:MAG: VPLPA-CTERM sorting domain-containing protein [Rhizobiaceae bacterium]